MPSASQTDGTEQVSDETPIEEPPSADVKRRELVDELFQKRIDKPAPVVPEITARRERKGKPVYSWAIGIITACLVIGVSLLLFSGKSFKLPKLAAKPTPTPTPTVIATPTPTPEEVKKSSVTIQVLNGGGKAGAATKMKTLLESKGYTVKDTGNADAYTYDKTEIVVKASKQSLLSVLESDLSPTYTLGTSAATLAESAAYDARVTVGKE
jgi:hypothetical protein